MPDQSEIDAIIERHRQVVESDIRQAIILMFRYQPAWSQGGLTIALEERHVSFDDLARHYRDLGIHQVMIQNPVRNWWMWFVPDNWNPNEETK